MNIRVLWLEVIWASLVFLLGKPQYPGLVIGGMITFCGCVLMWITISRSSLGSPFYLNPKGMYTLARHPRILAEVMLFLGLTIASHHSLLFAFFLAAAGLVVPLRIRQIEAHRHNKFGDPYRVYQSKVSTFFPQVIFAKNLTTIPDLEDVPIHTKISSRKLIVSSALTSTYIAGLSFFVLCVRLINSESFVAIFASILAFGIMFYLVARIDRMATLRELKASILNIFGRIKMAVMTRRNMRI